MKDVVRLLFITGAAVVAFGPAPQVAAQKVIPCPLDEAQVEQVCAFAPFEYMRLENILNTDENFALSYCACPDVRIEECSDSVCSDLGEQILAPDSSRVSYGDGLVGSTCKKETVYIQVGGDTVPYTVRVCK